MITKDIEKGVNNHLHRPALVTMLQHVTWFYIEGCTCAIYGITRQKKGEPGFDLKNKILREMKISQSVIEET